MNLEPATKIASEQPITVLVSRRPRKGMEQAFEKALSDTIHVALQFPGHLGVTVLNPQPHESQDYRIVVKFDSETHYQQWYHSAEARYWFDVLAQLEARSPNFEVMTGLETWFKVGDAAVRPMVPPPLQNGDRHLDRNLFASRCNQPIIREFSGFFANRSFVLTVVLVGLMTYVVMPREWGGHRPHRRGVAPATPYLTQVRTAVGWL
jgi:hypothetical protein